MYSINDLEKKTKLFYYLKLRLKQNSHNQSL